LRLSRRSSTNDTSVIQSADESKSNDDGKKINVSLTDMRAIHPIILLDDSDPNPKRKKTDDVNETLVRIPLNLG
jgi:hypothetical protein